MKSDPCWAERDSTPGNESSQKIHVSKRSLNTNGGWGFEVDRICTKNFTNT